MTDTTPATWELDDTELFIRYGDAFVPRREEQISTVVDLLGDLPEPSVLDVCCGQGLLSEAYLSRHPGARVVLMDGSEEMLADATARVEARIGDVEKLVADIHDRDWRQGLRCGGVVSSLAIHHLDGAEKAVFYRDVHEMLLPGGMFVMADLVEPVGAAARAVAADHWEQGVAAASEAQYGGDGALRAFVDSEWNYYRLTGPDPVDKPSSVAEHLGWLTDAGFEDVDVVWMYGGHAIFTARRRAES